MQRKNNRLNRIKALNIKDVFNDVYSNVDDNETVEQIFEIIKEKIPHEVKEFGSKALNGAIHCGLSYHDNEYTRDTWIKGYKETIQLLLSHGATMYNSGNFFIYGGNFFYEGNLNWVFVLGNPAIYQRVSTIHNLTDDDLISGLKYAIKKNNTNRSMIDFWMTLPINNFFAEDEDEDKDSKNVFMHIIDNSSTEKYTNILGNLLAKAYLNDDKPENFDHKIQPLIAYIMKQQQQYGGICYFYYLPILLSFVQNPKSIALLQKSGGFFAKSPLQQIMDRESNLALKFEEELKNQKSADSKLNTIQDSQTLEKTLKEPSQLTALGLQNWKKQNERLEILQQSEWTKNNIRFERINDAQQLSVALKEDDISKKIGPANLAKHEERLMNMNYTVPTVRLTIN